MAKAGRKPKTLDDEQRNQIEALAAYLSQDMIADFFGISRPTLAAMIERDPDISLRYKRGKSKAIAKVGQGLVAKALSGDTASAIFYMKTQAGWKETTVVDNKSSDGTMTPKPTLDATKLSPEAMAEILNAATDES